MDKLEVPLPSLGNGYLLDFGPSNVLGQPVSLYLKVVNNSAVPTFLETSISNFPAASVTTLPQHGNVHIVRTYVHVILDSIGMWLPSYMCISVQFSRYIIAFNRYRQFEKLFTLLLATSVHSRLSPPWICNTSL